MYDYLDGKIASRALGRLVLEVSGLGYDVLVPLTARIPAEGRMKLFVHLSIREDSHTLYGFPERAVRDLFRLLLGVRGVGPTLALGLLSGIEADQLARAVLDEDPAPLTRVRGVGKKTAAQILLDLKNKHEELAALAAGAEQLANKTLVPEPRRVAEKNLGDAAAALISVGYSEKEARKQVEAAAAKVGPLSLEELVRVALQS